MSNKGTNFPLTTKSLQAEGKAISVKKRLENQEQNFPIIASECAFFKAVSEGKQDFTCIAISADLKEEFVGPCGACRLVQLNNWFYVCVYD